MANSSYKGATDTRQLLIGQSKAQGRDQGVKSEVGKANLISGATIKRIRAIGAML